jgi:hypothetical protein
MRRVIAAVLLVLLASGCTHYRRSDLPPERAVQEGSTVKVTLKSGQQVELWQPWGRGDSIGGKLRNHEVCMGRPGGRR